jgi:hypothetical protein
VQRDRPEQTAPRRAAQPDLFGARIIDLREATFAMRRRKAVLRALEAKRLEAGWDGAA